MDKMLTQKKYHILLIGHDTLMCISIKGLLEENGYAVYTTLKGDEAVHVLDKRSIDLVIIDLVSSDAGELSIINKIKTVAPNILMLIMIGRHDIKAVINSLCLDTVDYILKPFDPDYFKKTIEKSLYRQQLEASLKKTLVENEIISNINKIIATSLDIRESFSTVCSELKKIIPFDRASIIISNEQGQWFQVFTSTEPLSFSEIKEGESFPLAGSLLEEIIKTGEPVVVDNTETGRFWTDKVLHKEGVRSRLGFPLIYKGGVLGAIAFRSEKQGSFDEQSCYYLWQIAPQIAIALENTKLFNRIKASEERYKAFFNHATDSMMMMDLNGRILMVNQCEEKIIGYKTEELLGAYIYDLCPRLSKRIIPDLLIKAIHNKAETTEVEVINKSRQTLVMELDIAVVKEGSNVLYLLAHFRDITKRKHLEVELTEEKQKLDNIVSEIGVDLLVIDRDYKICWANKRLIENHPLGARIVNHPCFEAYCHFPSVPNDCPSAKVFKTGKVSQVERLVVSQHHKKKYCNIISSPIFDKEGNVVQVLEVIQDVTSRKQEEEREKKLQQLLIHSDRLISIGRLAAGVAHEINTPLAVLSGMIQGFLEKEDAFVRGNVKEFKTMQKVAKRIEKTVDSLLYLSHFEGNERPRLININELIKNTVALIVEQFTVKNKKIVLKLSTTLPKIQGFAEQLQQIFMNLLINADDATGEGDTVSITTSLKEENLIHICFKDTGQGIPEEYLSKIFDPFFTTKEVGKGTGLGLSITYGIIERHHGMIYAKSKMGKGTTFNINLPVDFRKAIVHGQRD